MKALIFFYHSADGITLALRAHGSRERTSVASYGHPMWHYMVRGCHLLSSCASVHSSRNLHIDSDHIPVL